MVLKMLGAAVAAFALCYVLLRWLLSRHLLHDDIPNQRSMHQQVIPRGGGLAVVVSATLVLCATTPFIGAWNSTHLLLLGPLLIMSVVGWLDDRAGLGIITRLMAQITVALMGGGYLLLENTPGWPVVFVLPAVILCLVWMANLYNFMDGIDGLAGSQGVIVFAVLAGWLYSENAYLEALFAVTLSTGCLAFLTQNWYPARVFMGDVGSLAIGMSIGVLALTASSRYAIPLAAGVVLMMAFIFDATFTLLRRMFRGEKWWHAHRSHLYQRAAQFMNHWSIVIWVIAIDVVFAALATMVVVDPGFQYPALGLSVFVMVLITIYISRMEGRLERGQVA